MAELAILRVFLNYPKFKVLYITPKLETLKRREIEWKHKFEFNNEIKRKVYTMDENNYFDIEKFKSANLILA